MSYRYSIIPGDFVEEPRADINHFRVLHILGRYSKKSGWVKHMDQSWIGEIIGVSRQTVNKKIRDLVDWGYVDKVTQKQNHKSVCFYRVIMDRHGPQDDDTEDENVEPAPAAEGCQPRSTPPEKQGGCHRRATGGVNDGRQGVSTLETTGSVNPRVYEGCRPKARHKKEIKSSDQTLTQNSEGERLDVALASAGQISAIVESHLLRPICGLMQVRVSNPKMLFDQLARKFKSESGETLAQAADHLTETRKVITAAADIFRAVEYVKTTNRPIPKPRAGMLVFRTQQEFVDQVAAWRAGGKIYDADRAEDLGRLTLPHDWKPINTEPRSEGTHPLSGEARIQPPNSAFPCTGVSAQDETAS